MKTSMMTLMMLICALLSSVIATSAMAQDEVASDEAIEAAALEDSVDNVEKYSGFQIRLMLGGELGTLTRAYLDFNGNDDEYYFTDYMGLNSGLEIGYVWNAFGIFVRSELSSLWTYNNLNELNSNAHWTKAEIEAVFRGYFTPKTNIRPFVGVGLGALFYGDVGHSEKLKYMEHEKEFLFSIEGGVEWYVTDDVSVGFRVKTAFAGLFSGYVSLRPSFTLGYTF